MFKIYSHFQIAIKISRNIMIMICFLLSLLIVVQPTVSNEYAVLRNIHRDINQFSEAEKTMSTARQMIAKHKEEVEFWQRITQESMSMSISMSMSMPIRSPTNKPTKNPAKDGQPTKNPTKDEKPSKNLTKDGKPTKNPTKKSTKNKDKLTEEHTKDKTEENNISLGDSTFFGSGCPNNSVQAVLSSGNEVLSVLFSKYEASTSGSTINEQSSCQLAIPIDIKGNLKVGIFGVDYRGYTYVPEEPGAMSTFNTEYFFAGVTGPKAVQEFKKAQVFTLSNKISYDEVEYSPCGSNIIFRINTSITAEKKNEDSEDVEIVVDTTDVTVDGKFHYDLIVKEC